MTPAQPASIAATELPPLPEPKHRGPSGSGSYFDSFTAHQMHAYLLANRASHPSPAGLEELMRLADEYAEQACRINRGYAALTAGREARTALESALAAALSTPRASVQGGGSDEAATVFEPSFDMRQELEFLSSGLETWGLLTQTARDEVHTRLLSAIDLILNAEDEPQAPSSEPQPAQSQWQVVRDALSEFRLANWVDSDGERLPLTDLLCHKGDGSIERGASELNMMCDEIMAALKASSIAPSGQERALALEALTLARDVLEHVNTSETFFNDPRGDKVGPAIDAIDAALAGQGAVQP